MAEAVAAYLHDSPASARESDFQPGVILPSPSLRRKPVKQSSRARSARTLRPARRRRRAHRPAQGARAPVRALTEARVCRLHARRRPRTGGPRRGRNIPPVARFLWSRHDEAGALNAHPTTGVAPVILSLAAPGSAQTDWRHTLERAANERFTAPPFSVLTGVDADRPQFRRREGAGRAGALRLLRRPGAVGALGRPPASRRHATRWRGRDRPAPSRRHHRSKT